MDRERLDKWIEWGVLGVVLAILCYGPLALGAVRMREFLVLQGLTVVAIGLWVARFWVNRSHRIQWPPICWAVVAFVIYALIRYHQADVEYVARLELIRIIIYAFLFFIILNNLHRQETVQILVWAVLCLGMLVALYALFQFLTGTDRVWTFVKPAQYHGRGSGTYICPNHLAGLLEMLLPIALAGVFLSRSGHVTRVFYGYVAFVLLAGILASVSRGGWISTGLALIVFFGLLLRYSGYRKPVLVTLLLVALATFFFVRHTERAQQRFNRAFTPGQLDAAMIRPHLWGATYQMWRDHFWVGVGPAHFDVRFRGYRPDDVQTRPCWAHNDYLNALADWGAVGGAIIAVALACLGVGALKTWKYVHRGKTDFEVKRSDRAAHVFGVSIGLLALLIHSVTDFNMQIPGNAILAVALMASLSSHLRFATGRYWVTPHLTGRLLATVVGVVGMVYLAQEGLKRYRETTLLQSAENAKSQADQLKLLKAAWAVEPLNSDTTFAIGEVYRRASWEGEDGWRDLARQAMDWFDAGMRLNPWDTFNFLRYGMCLDKLKNHAQAAVYLKHALALDPNNYYIVLIQGWHQLQLRNFRSAKGWLNKSIRLKWYANYLAYSYLEATNQRIAEEEAEEKEAAAAAASSGARAK